MVYLLAVAHAVMWTRISSILGSVVSKSVLTDMGTAHISLREYLDSYHRQPSWEQCSSLLQHTDSYRVECSCTMLVRERIHLQDFNHS